MEDEVQRIVGKLFLHPSPVAVRVNDMDVGVLSRVFHVTVEFDSPEPPRHLVVKCPRPEFPFVHSMFEVEKAFYTATKHDAIPFLLPPFLHASTDIVVLDKVDNIERFSCLDGCPAILVVPILRKLGAMHAAHWGQSFPQLAAVPGIGASLTGEAKQTQFPSLFGPFLAQLDDPELANAMEPICTCLSLGQTTLSRIHTAVESWPHKTLLHGDFHVANMLFDCKSDDIWLLDWATAGASNPLRDVAFFFIVGVAASVRRDVETAAVNEYARIVTEAVPNLTPDDVWEMYRLCLVNQFLILVVYNQLTMSLADQGSSVVKQVKLRQGFLETNRRACWAVLSAWPFIACTLGINVPPTRDA
ncbi:hypothetical protein H310_03205 [Aphanomyces invadans]|uniref:CHK kinase-like domain-containing protein n=1 Tax=Aphanomyces invadans TaxID=157072 RepID=A0A024UGZ4_9STRA|nr:hypothetical protein H310_03205 [Aphanomyces invadans]ETW05440.1 hypothetical protein H310_03205 [Aphanomyces invadans]|eukprot:XP_008865217.1 hypothetical protein H310_03205 [Aphanomyces invadans]